MELQECMNEQRSLQFACYPKFISDNTKEKRLQDNLKHIMHEVVEVERETNFKHWKQPVQVNWDNVKDELVDVFIFFMNACAEADMDAKELFKRTQAKQKINRARQEEGY